MDYSGLIPFWFLSPISEAPLILVTTALLWYFVIHNNKIQVTLGSLFPEIYEKQ